MTEETLQTQKSPESGDLAPDTASREQQSAASISVDPSHDASKAVDDKSPAQPDAQRFLGGRRTFDENRTRLPRWFGFYVLLAATVLCLIAFGSVGSWLFVSPPDKPELVCMVEADYISPAIPFVRYGLQDGNLIRSLGNTVLDNVEPVTSRDPNFDGSITKHSFEHLLGLVQNETCVIYVAAHGVSDEQDGYLLHRSSRLGQFDAGLSLSDMLEIVTDHGATNVLLLLDTVRIDRSLQLGMLGNDFSYYLKRDFENLKKKLETREGRELPNVCIVCSADDGQISAPPPGLEVSPFALTVAYALRGGPGQATTKFIDSNGNGEITALELAAFVERAVSDWSLEHQRVSQTPFHLQMGEDFPLVTVDREVTLGTVLAASRPNSTDPSQLDVVQKSTKPEPKKEDQESIESPHKEPPATPADATQPLVSTDDTSPTAAEVSSDEESTADHAAQDPDGEEESSASISGSQTVDQLIDRIYDGWQLQRAMKNSGTGFQRPLQWSRLKLALMRAEEAVLANMPEKAQRLLDHSIPKIVQELQTHAESICTPNWSLAFDSSTASGKRLVTERIELNEVIADPTDERVSELESSNLIEAGIIGVLSERFRIAGAWQDTELVKLAVMTRSACVPTMLYQHPYLLSFVQDEIAAADAIRRQAEIDLITGRLDQAQRGLYRAETLYRNISADLDQYLTQFTQLKEGTTEVAAMVSWLGMRPGWDVRKHHDLQLLEEFITSIKSFSDTPNPTTLSSAAHSAVRIRQRGIQSAEQSLQPVDWVSSRAVLQLSFIAPELRRQLLLDQYPGPNFKEFNIGFRQDAITSPNRPANPMLLDTAFKILLNVESLPNLLSSLQQLSPLRKQGFESFADLQEHPAIRHERAVTSAEIRQFINDLYADPSIEFAEGTWWERWVRVLMLSDFRASRYLKDDPRDVPMQRLLDLAELELLKWNVDRLYEDSLKLPGYCYGNSIHSIAERIVRIDPSYVAPVESRYFTLTGSTELTIPPGKEIVVPLRIVALQDSPKDANPRLILRRSGIGPPLRFAVGGQQDVNGRVSFPLDTSLVAGQVQRVWLKVTAPADVERVPKHAIAAMIECATGQVDWLPLFIAIESPHTKPAELAIAWDDRAERNGRIDLYPNESLPLDVSILKHTTDPLDLRVEFTGSTSSESVAFAAKSKEVGQLPVVPVTDLSLSLEQTLTVRLYDGTNLLDEREIDLAILDLLRSFGRKTYFDPQAGKVRVDISRVRSSDARDAVPVEIQLSPIPAIQGTLTGQMPLGQENISLEAVVPPTEYSNFRVETSLAGVSRVFRDQIGLEQLAGKPDEQLSLKIVDPQPDTKLPFRDAAAWIPIRVQIDGPAQIGFHIGLDWNHNGQLDSSEVQQGRTFWNGKMSRVNLVSTKKAPGFLIESRVSDITLDLNTAGVIGQQTILARTMASEQSRTVSIPIYVLKTAPDLEILQPTSGQILGLQETIRAVVQTEWSLAGAVDNVEFAFDKNGNGKIDKGEAVVPLGFKPAEPVTFGKSHRLEVQLPTKGLAEGPMTMLARTVSDMTDPSTESGTTASGPVEGKAATTKKTEGKIALTGETAMQDMVFTTTGKIEGQVVAADGTPRKGAVVQIEGAGKVVSGDQGRFTFNNVPAGSHKVTAETNQRSGAATADVEPGQTVNLKIMIAVK